MIPARSFFLRGVRRALDEAVGATVGLGVLARGLGHKRRPVVGLAERLGALAGTLPVARPVVIHWNDHQMPFLEAEGDDDLAVALGAVHAHLRLAQMELLRRLAFGRTAEVVGPAGIALDHTLRLLDFPRAVPAIVAGLAPPTRAWADAFLRGVNCQIATGTLPEEFRVLGIGCAPWTLEELFTAARLAAADVNWMVWSRLLHARRRMTPARWAALWPGLVEGGAEAASGALATTLDKAGPGGGTLAAATLGGAARVGSNACAVSAARSASGAALLAADPHLSVSLPNIWLAAGVRSPTYNAVGLMPAGFPVFAIGRNPWMAWGGTSLHASSSELFDASGLATTERETVIGVRGGASRRVCLRECALGPILTDAPPFCSATPMALRWMGHAPSDEMGAMLGILRARSAENFSDSLAGFAVPAQNMVHAGRDGRVGHLLAARLPRRAPTTPPDLAWPAREAAAWEAPAGTAELPHWRDPPAGFVASANDRPPDGPVAVGVFFSPPDRVERMRALLTADRAVTPDALGALQRDTLSVRAMAARDALLARLAPKAATAPAAQALAAWDGRYEAGSPGALAYEVLTASLARRLLSREQRMLHDAVWTGRALTAQAILVASDATLRPALEAGLRQAGRALRRWRDWGGVHRLALRHPLSAFPVLGRRYRFGDHPADGGNDTLAKTGHASGAGRHRVTYGASARFIADLAHPDANSVVLLGGQDGWLGSTTFLDQVADWRAGRRIALPLQPETARLWPHHTVHTPRAG